MTTFYNIYQHQCKLFSGIVVFMATMMLFMGEKELGKALRAWRIRMGLDTQEDLASELGLKRGTIASWEAGAQNIPEKHLIKLKGMGFDSQPEQFATLGPLPWPELPYIGRVSASDKVDWTDPFASEDVHEVPTRLTDTRGCFTCHCASDSMMPLIKEGDLLVFKASEFHQVGKIIIHRSSEGLLTIKQLKHDGKDYILHPLNPKYEDVIADGVQLGYLIGVHTDTYSVEVQSGLSPKDFPSFS